MFSDFDRRLLSVEDGDGMYDFRYLLVSNHDESCNRALEPGR